MASLCREKNVALFLINTPLHEEYNKRIPPEFITYFNQEMTILRTEDVPVLDLHNWLNEDRFFANHNHVSAEGAKLVSQKVKSFFGEIQKK